MFAACGYRIYAHPAFLDALEALLSQCLDDQTKRPDDWSHRAAFKRLRAVLQLVTGDIPADPINPRYRLGKSLGAQTGWFRAKFGNGRFRLFYRVSVADKILILGWLNDAETLRTYGARDDAYAAFARRLRAEATQDRAERRMAALSAQCQALLAALDRPTP